MFSIPRRENIKWEMPLQALLHALLNFCTYTRVWDDLEERELQR